MDDCQWTQRVYTRLYINHISAIYNAAAKAELCPKQQLQKGIQSVMPTKMVRQILTEEDLRCMRYANLPDCKHLAYARDLFMFSVYGRGISFTDMAISRKAMCKEAGLFIHRK